VPGNEDVREKGDLKGLALGKKKKMKKKQERGKKRKGIPSLASGIRKRDDTKKKDPCGQREPDRKTWAVNTNH